MAINYTPIAIRGKAAEPVITELIFENKTVAEGYVTFEDDVKAETIFTEGSATVNEQAYSSGQPTASGSLTNFDVVVTPVKVMYYDEFDPETIRFSRFKRDMQPGAWNILSNEFERVMIGGVYAKRISFNAENKFWNNVSTATQTAVAALTAGSAQTSVSTTEKALIASKTAGLYDGIVAKMIYNNSNAAGTAGVGGRVKVDGTTITASNIKAEYDKVYAAIPAVVLEDASVEPFIYAPHEHKQMINIFNNNPANYKDAFSVSDDKKMYWFNGVEIKFVPFDNAKTLIAAPKEHLRWCTDLVSDQNVLKIEKIANNREDMFIKAIMTCAAHVSNQAFNVLYVG